MARKIYVIDTSSIRVLVKYYWNIVEGIKEKIRILIEKKSLYLQ